MRLRDSYRCLPASGKAFSFTQTTTICRLEAGRITDIYEDFDWWGLLRQLGCTINAPEWLPSASR